MSKKPLNISEEAAVQMPMKTVASLIIIVALGTMGYFQIVERLNIADTRIQLMEKDLEENTEFRIKWPRGQLGSLPADSEQFMMIEDLYKSTDKLNKHIESMALNKVNIEFLRKQMDKFLSNFFGGIDNFVNKISIIISNAYKNFIKLFQKKKKKKKVSPEDLFNGA